MGASIKPKKAFQVNKMSHVNDVIKLRDCHSSFLQTEPLLCCTFFGSERHAGWRESVAVGNDCAQYPLQAHRIASSDGRRRRAQRLRGQPLSLKESVASNQ
jgi:hypothetical protein